jgi:hypothetical protein
MSSTGTPPVPPPLPPQPRLQNHHSARSAFARFVSQPFVRPSQTNRQDGTRSTAAFQHKISGYVVMAILLVSSFLGAVSKWAAFGTPPGSILQPACITTYLSQKYPPANSSAALVLGALRPHTQVSSLEMEPRLRPLTSTGNAPMPS